QTSRTRHRADRRGAGRRARRAGRGLPGAAPGREVPRPAGASRARPRRGHGRRRPLADLGSFTAAGSFPARAPTPRAARGPGVAAADPGWDEELPPAAGHWREDKVALLLTMKSMAAAVDPCPDIPAGFLDVVRIPKLARQLKKNVRATEDAVADSDEPAAAA